MTWTSGTKALPIALIAGALTFGAPAYGTATCALPALAFRLDDVQDYWLSDSQKAVIQVFERHDFPLTLAVIGGFFGEDRKLVDTIRSHLGMLEIANHGLHAKNDTEGRSILLSQNLDTLAGQIQKSSDRIQSALGTVPDVFIPHKNQFDDDVLTALKALEYHYISSACSWHTLEPTTCEDRCGQLSEQLCHDPDPYGLIHLPVGASTQWEPSPGKGAADPEAVWDEIRRSTDHYGFAVVMLHPQDFVKADKSVDLAATGALGQLLSKLRDGTHRVVRLSEVARRC